MLRSCWLQKGYTTVSVTVGGTGLAAGVAAAARFATLNAAGETESAATATTTPTQILVDNRLISASANSLLALKPVSVTHLECSDSWLVDPRWGFRRIEECSLERRGSEQRVSKRLVQLGPVGLKRVPVRCGIVRRSDEDVRDGESVKGHDIPENELVVGQITAQADYQRSTPSRARTDVGKPASCLWAEIVVALLGFSIRCFPLAFTL